jgi:hypothetical protein
LQKKMPNYKCTRTFGQRSQPPTLGTRPHRKVQCASEPARWLCDESHEGGRPNGQPAYHQPSAAPDNLEQTRTAAAPPKRIQQTDSDRRTRFCFRGLYREMRRTGGSGGRDILGILDCVCFGVQGDETTQRVDLHHAKDGSWEREGAVAGLD